MAKPFFSQSDIVLIYNLKKPQISNVGSHDLGSYSPIVLKNILRLVLQIFLKPDGFECNTTNPIRGCVTFKFAWLVVLEFNATLTTKVISWRSATHMRFMAFSHQY